MRFGSFGLIIILENCLKNDEQCFCTFGLTMTTHSKVQILFEKNEKNQIKINCDGRDARNVMCVGKMHKMAFKIAKKTFNCYYHFDNTLNQNVLIN